MVAVELVIVVAISRVLYFLLVKTRFSSCSGTDMEDAGYTLQLTEEHVASCCLFSHWRPAQRMPSRLELVDITNHLA